jgi:catechol 2,3-dioxygenase-like lactoylglutathione lyase family enzyme
MARVQLALNVSDLDESIDFYSKLFGATPAKVRPGYANFALTEPPLKLVLVQSAELRERGAGAALNHLGVEVETADEVSEASARLFTQGLQVDEQHATTCCYAVQDKVWLQDPDGVPWEIYTVLRDAPPESGLRGDGTCCGGTTVSTAHEAVSAATRNR